MLRKIINLIVASLLLVICVSADAEIAPVAIRGDRIFTMPVLDANGGVILQASARFLDKGGKEILPADLTLKYQGATACVMWQSSCFQIPMSADLIRPLSKWIGRKRTAAFSMLVTTDNAEVNRFVAAEYRQIKSASVRAKCGGDPCYVSPEFYGTSAEALLYELDFTEALESAPAEAAILKRLNKRQGVSYCPELELERLSYVNTDVDSAFVVRLEQGKARISGTLFRYAWRKCANSEMPYMYGVAMFSAASPAESSAHNGGIAFAQVAALLRSFENRPDQLAVLAQAPSSIPPSTTKPSPAGPGAAATR